MYHKRNYEIDRKKARNTQREQEVTIRAWEEDSPETPGVLSTKQKETEENEINVEIVEEIVIDVGSSNEKY